MREVKGKEYYERHLAGETWQQIADAEKLLPHSVRNVARRWRKRTAEKADPQFSTQTPEPPSMEQLIRLARDTQLAVDAVDPILTHCTIKLESDAPIAVIFTSCAHLGSRYVQYAEFEKLLNEVVKIPRLYWLDMGDQIEGMAGFFDVASAHEQALADPKLQRLLLAHVLDRLAGEGKLLAGFAGQHGADWARRKSGTDPIKALYMERNLPYFDGQAYIKLDVGAERYRLFASHRMPGSSLYNKNHAQKRASLFKAPTADVIAMGDAHCYSVQQSALDTWEYLAGERPSYMQYLVQVGALKTGADPYTIKTWSPAVWEWPILVFRHDRHQIVQAADLDMLRLLLNDWR